MRLRILFIGFIAVILVLVGRLFYWQVIKGTDLSRQARNQYSSGQALSAPRGDILAANGTPLAASIDSWLLFAELPKIENIDKTADALAPLLVKRNEDGEIDKNQVLVEASRIKTLLGRDDVVWVPLINKLDTETKIHIESLKISGLGFDKQEVRYYPENSTAAHLLGFVGKDAEGADQGYFGLEGYYDLMLSGKPGFRQRENNAAGVPILVGDSEETAAIDGVDLLTNIDKGIQLIVEKQLEEGLEKYGAVAGTVIVMDPSNGAILAMASLPSYEPNNYFEFGDEFFKNPANSFVFEPGSIFKVLVMAAGIDAGVVNPDTKCDICGAPLPVDKYFIKTWNGEYEKDRTMTQTIVHSDNVGMAFVGQRLGADKLYDYLSAFGIGELTGIDLQGEVAKSIREKGTWNIVDLATASFGQGIAATPIQLVRAVAAIANDGMILTPRVVRELSGDNWSQENEVPEGKRVISKETADAVSAMMVAAAKDGEAKWVSATGFDVAGKTGTAQIPIAGHYDKEKTIASFIGFAPSKDPDFIMLVTLREPTSSPWASETAAPLWFAIAEDLFLHFGIQPKS